MRRVASRLAPGLLKRFEDRGVLYRRSFNPGLGLTWQEGFWTSSRAEVERYAQANEISLEWMGEDGLRTTAFRPAFRVHPVSGERLWFNHAAFFHEAGQSSELRAILRDALPGAELPSQTFYGDGSPIDPHDVEAILAAYSAEAVAFPWQRGDVLLLDNMTVAHGRSPFDGERKVVVAMTDPMTAR